MACACRQWHVYIYIYPKRSQTIIYIYIHIYLLYAWATLDAPTQSKEFRGYKSWHRHAIRYNNLYAAAKRLEKCNSTHAAMAVLRLGYFVNDSFVQLACLAASCFTTIGVQHCIYHGSKKKCCFFSHKKMFEQPEAHMGPPNFKLYNDTIKTSWYTIALSIT